MIEPARLTNRQRKIGKLAATHIGFAYFILGGIGIVPIDLIVPSWGSEFGLLHGAYLFAYVVFELVAIYALLAWQPRSVRHAAHVGFVVLWALLLCVSLIFRDSFDQTVFMAIAVTLIWAARFPGEWLSHTLSRHFREEIRPSVIGDSVTDIAMGLSDPRKARVAIGWSAAWASIGLVLTMAPLIPIPALGSALFHMSKLIFGLPWPHLAKLALFAAPGIGLALLGERLGAARAFPRLSRVAMWCALVNYLFWGSAIGTVETS